VGSEGVSEGEEVDSTKIEKKSIQEEDIEVEEGDSLTENMEVIP
jgi:hypothetical protein